MRVEGFKFKDFHAPATDVNKISVPAGSTFLNKVIVQHDGIYAYFTVPEVILSDDLEVHGFKIISGKDSVPDSAEFIDILSVVYEITPEEAQRLREAGKLNEAEPTQGLMLFTIFKLKRHGT
jgi:hypothetical protein